MRARAAALAFALGLAVTSPAVAQPRLRVGLLAAAEGDSTGASFVRGLELGLAEAAHAAKLVGGTVDIAVRARPADTTTLAAAARAGTIDALLGGSTPEGCRLMSSLAASTRVVWVNGVCELDPPDAAACAANVFHVAPTKAMLAHARRLAEATADAEVVMWHAALERFGAAQLGDRFRREYGRPMDGDAWAGWVAAKAVWDASARLQLSPDAALADVLSSPSFSFDAHKGRPLGFRPRDRRLRQPLYVRVDAERAVEVPRVARGASARAALDSLGADGPGCEGGSR